MSNSLNYAQNIFPGGAKKFLGVASPPLRPLGYGLAMHAFRAAMNPMFRKIFEI